ncbi:melanoma antigen preferentially expressed in tumors-like [Sorex fumeus]|uniref:melanoma antigen preferentially expressed in tumors-like n=1 Tax=Sorex fumeus TaxID=62283 RepID=UPI0024AD9BF8|nr:melanoma antigen preferentially expressed in tumors-like [Sorex fumeus]
MAQNAVDTLLNLAIKSLLSNESATIRALEELPIDLFVPLFKSAFLGRQKKILKAMVRVWPFRCLHIGTLQPQETNYDIFEAMIDGLQLPPDQNSSSGNLQIDNLSAHRSSLQIVDLVCTDRLELENAHLRDVNTLLSQLIHLESLSLTDVERRSSKGRNFTAFLACLKKLDNLEELSFSFFCLTNQLHKLLRVLQPQLDSLSLTFCDLSNRDIIALSQSTQAIHLKLLKLSNNQLVWEFHEPLLNLLENVSSTLQYLEINNCQITDSVLSSILPALSHCSHLRIFSFACNPITVPVLMNLVQHLTPLMELRYVIYPVPVDCYEQWDLNGSLDQEKLAAVKAQLNLMLQMAQREDMKWTTFPR